MLRLSVIIVGYNGASYLPQCLDSVLDQDIAADSYEIIYVDNQSQDDSVARVRQQYPQVRVVALDENRGYYGGFNYAAETVADGSYLLALPQDTIVHRGCLRALIAAADDDPRLMVGLVNTINPPASEYDQQDRTAMPDHVYWCATNRFGQTNLIARDFFDAPRDILAYSGVAALIRREAAEALNGYFDQRLSHLVGDTELGIRANVLGYRCKIIPQAVVFHIEDNKTFNDVGFLQRSFVGARDSIVIYYKLMYTLEFMLFSPLLLVGQATKVFTLRFPRWQRLLLFVPALLLSPVTYVLALRRMRLFAAIRREMLDQRPTGHFYLLRTVVTKALD
jgi:GT2 family glycosyltransferase